MQDRQQAKKEKKSMTLWSGKPLVVHYLSDNEQVRSTQEPCEIRFCCSELMYFKDTQKYYLSTPNHVRAGLLWPVCGAEIGTWIRRHKNADEALAYQGQVQQAAQA